MLTLTRDCSIDRSRSFNEHKRVNICGTGVELDIQGGSWLVIGWDNTDAQEVLIPLHQVTAD